ncbi:phosphate/phosphite/phosphonate ABC transporter substrate-binding protein [Psychromonas sp. KJ10-10]|uniref:phosphate/phosphite/phosphonate ABC transporter substrate-binding protein n=1 Tax=Psychromonas sp. KJ10-10 TaxID=3391823 RepID=UPI0039B36C2B
MHKLILFINLLLIFPITVNAQQNSITFGVVPQQSAKVLATQWTPILEYISNESGISIVFSTAKDIPTFEKRLKLGEYDVAYMNPYHYVEFNQSTGYDAIAKQQSKTIMGVIVAKKDGNIKTIYDLDGMSLAFPAPVAFVATILPQAELKRLNISYTPTYVSSHDSVYLNVSRGFFPPVVASYERLIICQQKPCLL